MKKENSNIKNLSSCFEYQLILLIYSGGKQSFLFWNKLFTKRPITYSLEFNKPLLGVTDESAATHDRHLLATFPLGVKKCHLTLVFKRSNTDSSPLNDTDKKSWTFHAQIPPPCIFSFLFFKSSAISMMMNRAVLLIDSRWNCENLRTFDKVDRLRPMEQPHSTLIKKERREFFFILWF